MSDKAPPNHEAIYLLDMGNGWAWCSDPDPDNEDRNPIKYIREDVARNRYAPKVTEKEAREKAASAIKAALLYVEYIPQADLEHAARDALKAAGLRFKEEA